MTNPIPFTLDGTHVVANQGETIWEVAKRVPNLKAAFIETSFPNSMQKIADISGHLSPQTLRD